MSAKTLYDKLWESHLVHEDADGTALIYIDRHLVHEVTSPQAYEGLSLAGRKVWRIDSVVATADHNTPTRDWDKGLDGMRDQVSRLQVETLDKNIKQHGAKAYFPFLDQRQGIVHVIGPELGASLPGMTLVCGDSHTSTHGALGCLAFGIGTSEVEHVLATQCLVAKKTKSMLIRVEGETGPGVTAKDIVLAIIGRIGSAGGTGYSIEYAGSAIRALSVEGRMTVCNMSIEAGARAGMVAVDDKTIEYVRGRPFAPKGAQWDQAVAYWRTLTSDPGAKFDKVVELDAAAIQPQVTWGTNPQMVAPIDGRVPDPAAESDPIKREWMERALKYMGLTPNTPISEIAIDKVFIGSCTNSRIEDLRAAAAIARGRKVEAARGRKDDFRRRVQQRQLYRTLDQTQEWAENNYYKIVIQQQGPDLVTINRFWKDYARHDGRTPFTSAHLVEASRNLTEMVLALSVLDLPFESSRPDVSYDGPKMTLKPKGRTALFLRQIKPAEAAADRVPILVSQNFLRDSDRYRHEGQERFDKYVTDEFLVHTVYVCQVVLTNPTSSPHKLDLLLQIPMGAMPAKNGFYSRSVPVTLASYATQSIEYAFYFAVPGTYAHFPVHVSKNERMIASAAPVRLQAVERLSQVDQTSWEYLSQHADTKTVLRFLDESNIDRLNLDKAAWRMSEASFFDAALSLLAKRHVYHPTLWSYAVHHKDPARTREFLLHQEHWLRQCGWRLDGGIAPIDPVEHRWFEHLEYAPLVNARAHRLGSSRRILNQRFAEQYDRLLSTLRYRARLTDDDWLAVAYYQFLQDRIEEGLAALDRVNRDRVATKLQYDYLQIAAEFFRERPKQARAIAEKHRDHPVDRWRKLFRNALAQLDEIEGDAAAVADPEDRDQRQGKLASTESAFDLSIEGRTVTIRFQNLAKARVNYYRMDIELLFSRQPFVQEQSDRFGFIMPNKSVEVALTKKDGVQSFELPEEFRGANVVVEVVAAGRRVSQPCFAHELAVQVVEPYGQVKVAHRATRKPLSKAYVKAYARQQDGTVKFFKDGYTDLRGRFDYSSLSTSDLDHVDRFALLVLSDEHGAVIQEAAPPKR